MKIERQSPLTKRWTTIDLPVTDEQMREFDSANRRLLQDIFPNLTQAEREFIKSGYSLEDQAILFTPPTDDDEDDDED